MRIAKGSGVTVTEVNNLVDRFYDAQKMMKQMGGMMGLPGSRRKATKSPKNKRKGTKGGNSGGRAGFPAGLPGGMGGMGGMPQLPPGLDPAALEQQMGGGAGFKAPKLDFGKLLKGDKDK